MRHHAIVVTSWQDEAIEAAHAQATALGMQVSNIVDGVTNGERSFFVAPDGSKEWWPDSDAGDERRAEFVAWLRKAEGRSWWLRWAEVQYGDDDRQTLVLRHSDDDGETPDAG